MAARKKTTTKGLQRKLVVMQRTRGKKYEVESRWQSALPEHKNSGVLGPLQRYAYVQPLNANEGAPWVVNYGTAGDITSRSRVRLSKTKAIAEAKRWAKDGTPPPPESMSDQRAFDRALKVSNMAAAMAGQALPKPAKKKTTKKTAKKKAAKKTTKKAAKKTTKKAAKKTTRKVSAKVVRRPRARADKVLVSPGNLRKALAAAMKMARQKKADDLKKARALCKSDKEAVRKTLAARKAKIQATWKKHRERILDEAARECSGRKKAVEASYLHKKEKAAALKRANAENRATMAAAKVKAKRSDAQAKALARAREKREEQLEEARNEVQGRAPHLLPYFEQVKHRLKKKKGHTHLAESFFQMVHDNPEAAMQRLTKKSAEQAREDIKQMQKGTQEQRISSAICRRAERAAKMRKPFVLQAREERALEKLGVDPQKLMTTCYPERRSRVVSGNTEFLSRRGALRRSDFAPF